MRGELVGVLGEVRPGLTEGGLAAVRDTLTDSPAKAVAAARNVSARTLRNRRDRTVHRLRTLAA